MKSNKPRSLIVAYGSSNCVIGDGKKMPKWKLKKDVQFFVDVTIAAGICITGRKNYESLPKNFRPLPGRKMIIVTENPLWTPEEESGDIYVVNSFWEALEKAESLSGNEICFIGGGQCYTWALRNVVLDKLHLTTVMDEIPFEGSVKFPEYLLRFIMNDYTLIKNETVLKDEDHSHSCIIRTWQRNAPEEIM